MTKWNMEYRFEYFQGEGRLVNTGMSKIGGAWFVRLRRINNGEILMVSEGYTRKWSAKRAAVKMARAFGAAAVEA